MARCDNSVTLTEECRITNPIPQQETVREITNPNPNKKENEMWMNYRMWTASPQTKILLKASLSCRSFEDSDAVIKMIIKGRSQTMRHVSRTHRVALDGLFDRIYLDPKIQIKCVDTKHQLADILANENFTRDEWNHLLSLFNISHFSSTACTAAMAKRALQGSGEERVTAKSRLMMNLTARMPSVVSSSTSSNPGRTSYGYQDPERYVLDDRTEQPVETSRSDYLQKDYGRSWSSQEWKSGAAERDRSGKPEKNSWDTLQKVDPHREEPLLGRNAHSARYGEIIHDGSQKPETDQLLLEEKQLQHREWLYSGSQRLLETCTSKWDKTHGSAPTCALALGN